MTPPPRRRRPDYEARRSTLSDRLKLALDLIEESIIADPQGTYRRRAGPGATVVDLSGYDEFGLIVAFRHTDNGPEFIEFTVWSGGTAP